jgi:hypothetical protein
LKITIHRRSSHIHSPAVRRHKEEIGHQLGTGRNVLEVLLLQGIPAALYKPMEGGRLQAMRNTKADMALRQDSRTATVVYPQDNHHNLHTSNDLPRKDILPCSQGKMHLTLKRSRVCHIVDQCKINTEVPSLVVHLQHRVVVIPLDNNKRNNNNNNFLHLNKEGHRFRNTRARNRNNNRNNNLPETHGITQV